MSTVVCHTEGCENENVALEMSLSWEDEDGNTQTVDSVVCGPCGQPIADIENPPDGFRRE